MKIQCSKCKKTKECRYRYYLQKIDEYGSKERLKERYACRDCKYPETPIYSSIKKLRGELKVLINESKQKDMNLNSNQQHFLATVTNIMAKYNIKEYRFNIFEDNIHSITLYNLPFIGTKDIKLKEQKYAKKH